MSTTNTRTRDAKRDEKAQAAQTSNEIMEDVYDLMATANRMADRYGWDDARVLAIQADIERYTAQALHTAAQHAA